MSVDDPIRSIVITSSIPNEGKSTVAVNLATAIATSGMRVLLVESDMRNRTLAGMLNVRAQCGLYSLLAEESQLSQALTPTTTENMFLLDAEPHIPNPADVLASKRFAQLASKLEGMFDYVVYDTPPVGTFVDAAIVSAVADATALVVRENFTKRQVVMQANDQLEKAGAHIVGVVANCAAGANVVRVLLRVLHAKRQARPHVGSRRGAACFRFARVRARVCSKGRQARRRRCSSCSGAWR